ncbi:MAG: glycerol-3-phosphate 1-O-acyltransferase PlsY [Candidatus Omnitrophica bacterium]|nr:glycerol-3-phosphate 1-O-acyltransferase PlsY [Candidatus Omnitrophota bacterium]MDD5487453.1 glycerol-3-phosphate 1-O-acyltransferase PlsY [Candidatus Omnitrophota bacterium]
MIYIFLAIICAYLIGSFPTAYIFGKAMKGIDIREHGSGNVGATNVARTIGKKAAIAVFIIDVLKGFVAVTLLPEMLKRLVPEMADKYFISDIPRQLSVVVIFLGVAAIAGHIWNVFLGFKGGKGVATTAGVIGGMMPVVLAACLLVWGVVFMFTRYVSIASISAALVLPVLTMVTGKDLEVVLFSCGLCFLGIYSHRSNIRRLFQGTENRFVKIKKSQ